MVLFSIHITHENEFNVIDYDSVRECLDDVGLETLLDYGAVCSLWRGQLRLTPDITDWDQLTHAVRSNAGVLWREG